MNRIVPVVLCVFVGFSVMANADEPKLPRPPESPHLPIPESKKDKGSEGIITQVVVKNARHLNLQNVPALDSVRAGVRCNSALNKWVAHEIETEYRRRGYFLAEVVLEEGSNAEDTRVVFGVVEGPIVVIRRAKVVKDDGSPLVNVPGCEAAAKLSKTHLVPGVGKPIISKLKEHYRSSGYLDATVTQKVEFSPDLRFADVTFQLKQGPSYRIRKVSVVGNQLIEENWLQQVKKVILNIQPGQICNLQNCKKDVENIKGYHDWNGYKVGVRYFLEKHDHQVDVRFVIESERLRIPARLVGPIIILKGS